MELNYYEIQVLNAETKDFDVYIVMALDRNDARLKFEKEFAEEYHALYYMRIKKLEGI
uniref:Phage protein n=1 Tax=Enterococcus phage vB_EFS_EFP6 TaxID=3158834 RepID=A0AAU7L245_9CAUD